MVNLRLLVRSPVSPSTALHTLSPPRSAKSTNPCAIACQDTADMASFPNQQSGASEHDVVFSPTLSRPIRPIVAAEASFAPFSVAGFEAPHPKDQLIEAQAQEIASLRERLAGKEKELDKLNTKMEEAKMKDLRYWKHHCEILEEKLSAYQGWCKDDATFLGLGLCASPASTMFPDELPRGLVWAGVGKGKGKGVGKKKGKVEKKKKKGKIGGKGGVKKRDARGRFCRLEKGYKA